MNVYFNQYRFNHRVIYLILSILFYSSANIYADAGLYKHIDLSANSVEECQLVIGDLDHDGRIDYLFNDGRRTLKAFDHDGNLLWSRFNGNDPGVEEPYHNYSISIYDIDLDNENEVICFLEINTDNCLCVLDGLTGGDRVVARDVAALSDAEPVVIVLDP